MEAVLRLYFLGFYGIGLLVFAIKVVPASLRVERIERRVDGFARWLPPALVFLNFVLPMVILTTRVGELAVRWVPMRILGIVVSVYAAAMLLSAAATLGRFLVPQAIVVADHQLVTRGPYRYVRHPAYSGDLALWLGAALATVNVLLLVLWPLSVLGTHLQARREEQLLAAKFGADYEAYARTSGHLFPRLGLRSQRP